jgi:UDP-2-acetamido-3-amino-2,3-dideoxy-glucuronate N-acetyltransferase
MNGRTTPGDEALAMRAEAASPPGAPARRGARVAGLHPSVFVHPEGLCESDRVGPRTRVWAFAHVLPGARVGADCNIGDHAYIEGGAWLGDRVTVKNAVLVWNRVTVEDEVFLGPNVVFTNDLTPRVGFKKAPDQLVPTVVRRAASIGANATVVCGVVVGQRALVAAGAVVTSDVAAHALVAGNPARRLGWVCTCGQRLPAELACRACARRFRVASEAAGLVPADESPVR